LALDVYLYSYFFIYRIPFPLPTVLLLGNSHYTVKKDICSLQLPTLLPRIHPLPEILLYLCCYQSVLHLPYMPVP
jgi:hypothetical protein